MSDIKPAQENLPDKKWVTITKIHQDLIALITHNYLNNSYFSLFSSFEKALLVTNGILSWNWVPCPQVNNVYQSWPEAKCRSTQKPEVCQCVWRVCSVAEWWLCLKSAFVAVVWTGNLSKSTQTASSSAVPCHLQPCCFAGGNETTLLFWGENCRSFFFFVYADGTESSVWITDNK